MKHVDVESTLIHSIGYDELERTLEVRLQDGNTYRYFDVEPELVEESKDQFFNDYRPRALSLASWTASEIEALAA